MTTLDLAALVSELRRIADNHLECDGCDEEKVFRAAAYRLETAERDKAELEKALVDIEGWTMATPRTLAIDAIQTIILNTLKRENTDHA